VSRTATCDTSVLVAALTAWHPLHDAAADAMSRRVAALASHVLIETYSVLTRLPAPHRVSPQVAGQSLAGLSLEVITLPGEGHGELVRTLARAGVRGGATYDALVAATARHHRLTLITADRRARPVYELTAVDVSML
jgi:predicted nucleic acid-binding protein